MDPDPDPDPTPDPDRTPFFSDFKDAKINFFYNLPTATLYSVLKLNFLLKICVKILSCKII